MHDARIDQLARQLVRYSTRLKAGEKLLIDVYDVPDFVPVALVRAARAVKAIPFVNLNSTRVSRELFLGAVEEQYDDQCQMSLGQMKRMQAYIAVRGSHNITETSDVPAKTMAMIMRRMRPVINYRVNNTRWCVLRWPNNSMAQQAGMSTDAFEDFFFRVCLLDYKALMPGMRALERLMSKTRQVHIKGNGTDLRFHMTGLEAIACGGIHNIPDGECFSAPVKESVEGVVQYNAPTIYQGIAFDNVRLEFEKGRILRATSNNSKAMNKILDSDPGARYIGEFALGFNREIREPMRDILFDEKIAGSFHFTPGQAYEGITDNGNRSQVHWDLVCIQRPDYGGGEIHFDGKLIRKDGKFTLKSLESLN